MHGDNNSLRLVPRENYFSVRQPLVYDLASKLSGATVQSLEPRDVH